MMEHRETGARRTHSIPFRIDVLVQSSCLFLALRFVAYLAHAGRDDVRLLARELPLECNPRLELLLL